MCFKENILVYKINIDIQNITLGQHNCRVCWATLETSSYNMCFMIYQWGSERASLGHLSGILELCGFMTDLKQLCLSTCAKFGTAA